MVQHIHIHLSTPKKTVDRKVKDADWSARHVGNFRFEVTTPQGKKISIARAETSVEAIEKAKKLPAGATHDFQPNITAKGRNYVSTGKMRKSASGEMEAEYEELGTNKERTGRFLWIAASGLAKNDSAKDGTTDSEENDAYIKGHKDGIEGKRQDVAYHPGGNKKPSVALRYAEGYRQGEKDRKAGGKDSSFTGSEFAWANKVRDQYPGVTFRPRPFGKVVAKFKDLEVGRYNKHLSTGTVKAKDVK